MILLNDTETTAAEAAKKIIWQNGAQWSIGRLNDYGINEGQLLEDERLELIEQLFKQEKRVRALFGL